MRVLGVDYGERRLGFAVSDPDGIIAMPIETIEVRDVKQALDAVRRFCERTGADSAVIGLPLNMNGTESAMSTKVKAFADRLRNMIKLPIIEWDERLSTKIAERVLLSADISRKKRKKARDKLSAQVILQGYLDSRAAIAYDGNEDASDAEISDAGATPCPQTGSEP